MLSQYYFDFLDLRIHIVCLGIITLHVFFFLCTVLYTFFLALILRDLTRAGPPMRPTKRDDKVGSRLVGRRYSSLSGGLGVALELPFIEMDALALYEF